MKMIDASPLYEWLACADEMKANAAAFDGIFVVGGSVSCAKRAAEVFHQGEGTMGIKLPLFFTSIGGKFGANLTHGKDECALYTSVLRDLGVDMNYVHCPQVEAEMTDNTKSEAQACGEFVTRVLGVKPQSLILCSRKVHQRRAHATFSEQNPTIVFQNEPDTEALTVELLPRLVQEWDRLHQYGDKGDSVKQKFPEEFVPVVEAIREHFPEHFKK